MYGAFATKTKNDMKTTNARLGKSGSLATGNKHTLMHLVPNNKFGIRARHSLSEQAISPADARKVFRWAIAPIEPDYQAEISKTADFKKCTKGFDPLSILLKCCPAPLSEKTKIVIWTKWFRFRAIEFNFKSCGGWQEKIQRVGCLPDGLATKVLFLTTGILHTAHHFGMELPEIDSGRSSKGSICFCSVEEGWEKESPPSRRKLSRISHPCILHLRQSGSRAQRNFPRSASRGRGGRGIGRRKKEKDPWTNAPRISRGGW